MDFGKSIKRETATKKSEINKISECKNGNDLYMRDGQYVYFGRWPNSKKADDVTILGKQSANGEFVDDTDENYYSIGSDGEKYQPVEDVENWKIVRYFKVEPIKWRIIDESDDTVLLLSEYIIDVKEFGVYSDYFSSNVREWLYYDFLPKAFTAEEKSIILSTDIDHTVTGADTKTLSDEDATDEAFLLSRDEVFNVFGFSDTDRMKRPTEYADAASAYKVAAFTSFNGCGSWWLREPAGDRFSASYINNKGVCDTCYCGISYGDCDPYEEVPDTGIVPALRIRINKKD